MAMHKKFTDARIKIFLKALSETGNVSHAAERSDMTRAKWYAYRKENEGFAEAWNDAMEEAGDSLEAEARRRAVNGVLEPVFYKGEKVGKVRKFSDVLLIFLLKGAKPEKYRERIDNNHDGSLNMTVEVVNFTRSNKKEENPDPQ